MINQQIFKNISDIPTQVDLVSLMIPAVFDPQEIQECGEQGSKAMIIISGGFSETGKQGAKLEAECDQIAAEFGIRLMELNCIGLIDTPLPLDTTF